MASDINKQLDWFFKKILFIWLPVAVVIIIIKEWIEKRKKGE